MPNLAQEAKSEMIVAVTGRERHTIFSIYAQRLLMGPKYNSATSLEELGSNKIYKRRVNALGRGSKSAKSGSGSQIRAVCCWDREDKANIPFNMT